MDWGVTIALVLSIIGAVILSGGDIIVGIIAFLVLYCVLAVIMKFITSGSKKGDPPVPSSPASSNAHIIFDEKSFALVHDQVIKFLQAYASERPDEWYHYFISQEFEHVGDTTCGYVQFQIMLGSWYNSLLRNEPELKDYMMSIFTFDPSENTFTYKMRSGTCSGCSYPQNEITKMVHNYVSNYEGKHPGMRFERHSWGVKYSNI